MTEQVLSAEAAILFLVVGVMWGLLFLMMKIVRIMFGFGKIAEAFFDMLLCLMAAMSVFLCALVFDSGRIRFFQLLLHIIGAAAVILSLGPFVQIISQKIWYGIRKIRRFFLSGVKKIFKRFIKPKEKKKEKKENKAKANQKKVKKHRPKIKEKRKST
ncbi:spore cortex biosynthesis protein YabQ [Scatolibacter rhodanostii]|uniref:spore cortex biosynthesis protein YabQ n=1 Tax=Scatolibacter rhodanostii TaxID=2014781 RepID=UPI000C080C28|nr:spore cortex biosynthesis protein YabQ [Scatolibacter rhodanostii]